MTSPDFIGLLRQATGIDVATIGVSALDAAIRRRLALRGFDDPRTYWTLLLSSREERQALIETIVIPETWFFRDREAFTALARHATTTWLPAHPAEPMRLLSLPCSTGEEPYSLSMALLDAGVPAERYEIDAIDISGQAISRAEAGLYGRNSFRGSDLAYRCQHFSATGNAWRINDEVRTSVHFRQGNLFDPLLVRESAIYDVILCRNLLIYFDRDTQDQALRALRSLLTTDGMLFVGPSEGAIALRHDLESTRVPLSFAYQRRVEREPRTALPSHAMTRAQRCLTRPQPSCETRSSTSLQDTMVGPPRPAESADEPVLTRASRLADQGEFASAAGICREHMRQHGPSAQAFYLLGLIASASGERTSAADHYRKALYLDRNHHDTLVHLSLLLEQDGEAEGAQVLRRRLQRLQAASCAS